MGIPASFCFYNLALLWAFSKMGPSLVAAIMLPLIFSLPCMNMFWALALPEMSFANSTSESTRVTEGYRVSID